MKKSNWKWTVVLALVAQVIGCSTASSEEEKSTVVSLGSGPSQIDVDIIQEEYEYTLKENVLTEIRHRPLCKPEGHFSFDHDTTVFEYSIESNVLTTWGVREGERVRYGSTYEGSGTQLEDVDWEFLNYVVSTGEPATQPSSKPESSIKEYKKWSEGKLIKRMVGELCWAEEVSKEKGATKVMNGCNSVTAKLPEGNLELTAVYIDVANNSGEVRADFNGKLCVSKFSGTAKLTESFCTEAWAKYEQEENKDNEFRPEYDLNNETQRESFESCLKDIGVITPLSEI